MNDNQLSRTFPYRTLTPTSSAHFNMKRVVCAISGGIDSAVSAILLKRKGFEVTGLFMTNWDHVEEGETDCPRTKDYADAKRICDHLKIELHSCNFVKEYWNEVFLPLIESYKKGKAVVPDVGCNSLIKFGTFYQHAFEKLGADAVATGHYARTSFGDFLDRAMVSEKPRLLRAKDSIKDQTYFLANVDAEKLRNTMFPIGSLYKNQVQDIAASEGLDFLLKKKESMGICFVGVRKNFSMFLQEYIESISGDIVLSSNGKVIGQHSGVHNFTLGKRVALPTQNFQSHESLFVSKLDYVNQILYVCEGTHHPSLYAKEFEIGSPTWINRPIKNNLEFALQRNQPLIECELRNNLVISRRPVRAAALGQMCVFYAGEECLGGGEVHKIMRTLDF